MNPEQPRPISGPRPPQMAGIRPVGPGAPIRPMMPLPQQGMARPPGMHPPMRPMTQTPMRPVMASPQARPVVSPQVRPSVVSPQVRPSVVSPQPRPAIMPTQPHEPTYQHQPAVSPPQQQQQPQNLVGPMQHMHIHQQSKQSSKPKRVYINPDTTQPQPQVQPQGQPQVHPQMQPQPQAPWPNSLQQPYSTPSPIKSHHQSAGVGYTNAPYTHTGQQLPPELRPPSQPRPRIDPDQMPAPVQVREADADLFQDKFFGTLERDRVPFATTSFIGLDQGNCNPRFMRSTVDRVPSTKELTDKSKLPVGLIVQPLAKQRSDEVPIQVVQHGEEGPVRCSRCRAYVNPWCVFTHGGSRFECNICLHSNQVPDWYFANVDMSGRRVDVNERPELRYGSVEFEVTPDYFATDRLPVPLSYVFAIDVSIQSVQSGMLQAVCEGLKHALYDTEGNPKLDNRIGIMTFNKDVHFYNLAAELTSAQMLVVSDIHDMFLPLQAGFLAHLSESRHVILELLDHLPQMFKQTTRAESVYTSAVKGGLEALKSTGGQIFVFQTCLPNYGPDSLKPRDDKALDKEKSLLAPQSDTYRDLGKTCVKHGVCVHTWAFASQYMDAATVQTVSHLTGGDFRHYPNFSLAEKYSLYYQLDHDIHRETGFDGILRVRCSDGLQVMDHYGHCHMSVYTECDLAGVDQDKAMAVVLKHDGKLDENRGVSFQCALLYTNRQGQRRVRVHNLHLAATSQIADVFRYGDVDATISVLLRQAIFDMAHKNRKDIHTSMTDHCVDVLTAYRLNCAASTSPGQLILPEAFKLLPVYVHGAIRSKVLRGVGTDINIDVRVAAMSLFNTLSVEELVWTLYPRMYPLHELSLNENTANLKGEFRLPHMMRTSYERLEAHGCYLVDTGSDLYLWLGKSLPSAFIQDLFGVKTLDQVDPHMVHLPVQPTVLSTEVHGIMRQLQASRTRHLALRVVRQEKDAIEFLFSTWMSEDRNAEIQTYVDYMCVLHRKIQEEMKKHSG